MVRIVITGYYGLGNVGDEMILGGIIKGIHTYLPEADIAVITGDANDTLSLHKVIPVKHSLKKGVKYFILAQIREFEFVKILKMIQNSDVFILGGGELLQDLKFHYLPAFYSLPLLAKKLRKKVVLYATGAGPIETRFGKELTRYVLNQFDLVTVRDAKSRATLEDCGVYDVIQTADPAFAAELPLTSLKQETRSKSIPVAVTLHKYLYYDDIYRKVNGRGVNLQKRRELITELLDNLIDQYNTNITFLPNVPFDMEGFSEIVQLSKYPNSLFIHPHSSDYTKYAQALSSHRLLVGMRMHSMIISTRLGIPFLPISYSSKVDDYVDLVGLGSLKLNIEEIETPEFSDKFYSNFEKLINHERKYSRQLLNKAQILKKRSLITAKLLSEIVWG